MKKLLFLGGIIAMMIWPGAVSAAADISLTPLTIDTKVGHVFDVKVVAAPGGTEVYTAKIELEYPVDILEVKSFSFSPGWTALSQPGYDLIDNQAGRLIKSAGYPGGISNSLTFGTISFLAKKAGNGVVKIGNDSLVLDATSQNVFNRALAQTSVVIKLPKSEPAPAKPTSPPSSESAVVLGIAKEPTSKQQTAQEDEQSPIDVSDKLASQEPGQESSKPRAASIVSQKMPDWMTLLLGFINGVLFTIIVFNALQRRKQKK